MPYIRDMSNYRTSDLERLAAVFGALSNAHRLRIFLRLASCCSAATEHDPLENGVQKCVGDLGKDLGIAPSTLSHHVKELKTAGLITVLREGQNVQCRVDEHTLRRLARFFAGPFDEEVNHG